MTTARVATIKDLRQVQGSFSKGDVVQVIGYSDPGDHGGGFFYFDPLPAGQADVDDNGMSISASANPPAMWRRIYSDAINVCWFGAKAEEENDNHSAFQNALNFIDRLSGSDNPAGTTLFVPFGRYEIWDTLRIKSNMILQGSGGSGRGSGTILSFEHKVMDGIVIGHAVIDKARNIVTESGAWTVIRDLGVLGTKSLPVSDDQDDLRGLTGGHGIIFGKPSPHRKLLD